MPVRDGTGPQVMDSMMGRRAGNCRRKASVQSPGDNRLPDNSNFSDGIRGFFRRSLGNKNRTDQGRGNRRRNM